jgi:atypical dual specificity phosphatase
MTRIWDRIYLGSLKDAQQLATANPCGISAVVSLCDEKVRRAANINYVHLPIADSRPIPAQKFDDIMQAFGEGVGRGPLLIHCVGGMSRSPIMVAAWMHRCGYMGIDRALAEISELRDIDPSPVLLKSVKERLIQ